MLDVQWMGSTGIGFADASVSLLASITWLTVAEGCCWFVLAAGVGCLLGAMRERRLVAGRQPDGFVPTQMAYR